MAAKRRIGFLPEQFRFHEWLRGTEFLDFHGELSGVSRAERRRRIPEVLDLVGLAGRGGDRLRTYSKGMLQRIGLAQALLNDPALIFLDEPTSALDPIGRREVREIIRVLKGRGMTVFLNSHILSEVESVCDRVAIVDRGRVVRVGPLAEVVGGRPELRLTLDRADRELLAALGRHGDVVTTQSTADGRVEVVLAVDDPDRAPAVARAALAAGAALYGLVPARRSLEDVFVSLVEGGDG
jgi:ABC-2 type transport system ATP-binding protein